MFRFRSPQHWLGTFRTCYGPTHVAFAALDADTQAAFAQDILHLIAGYNRGGAVMVVPADYLEVVITVR